MRKIIPLALMALTLMGGSALADRGRWDRDSSYRSGGTHVRDGRWNHRQDRRHYRDNGYRYRDNHRHVVIKRKPIYVNNGRFVFGNGYYRAYSRPVIRQRYYDYRYRPQIVVENYDTVPGYTWIPGHWDWNGYEWVWNAGHYEPDQSYQQQSYGYDYDGDGYPDSYNNSNYDSGYYNY